MSRIGKQPITIPDKTDVSVEGNTVRVKGSHGELTRVLHPAVSVSVAADTVTVAPTATAEGQARALWGTSASHIKNMIAGVNEPYQKQLIMEGIGFKVDLQGTMLVMALGFSHPVEMPIPEGLSVTVEKNVITISGIDKEKVGQFAAEVRSAKKPEPYKGKGIRYADEVIRRKQGKKAL